MTDVVSNGKQMEFHAAWAEADTRTVLTNNGTDIFWTPNEEINVFYGSRYGGKFISSNAEPQAFTTFIGTLTMVTGSVEQGNESSRYYAVYPYDEDNACDGQSVTLALSDKQTGKAGSFADKFFPAVAVSATPDLAFWNVCGGARFSVTREGIKRIVFKSNDGSPMAGKVKVGFGGDNKPQILEFTNPVDSIVVNAPEGGFVPGTNYFAAMLPQAHVKGMTISLSTQYEKASRTFSNAVTVHRSLFGVLDNVDAGLEYEGCGYAVPDLVDLGLPSGLKWASFNLGATKPEEYGNYFAWGETEPKSKYDWSTYKWCKGSWNTLTKYCTDSYIGYSGFKDNKTVLEPEDDAAAVALGGSWRMATYAEWDELLTKCTWTWTTQNGVNGYLVTGPNGNSIFLPAAGYRDGTSLKYAGSYGYYWSSSLYTGNSGSAFYVSFYSGSVLWHLSNRYHGRSVRPVTE